MSYPQNLSPDKYDKLWTAYKKYVLSDPLTRIDPPNKKRWLEIEKSFKRTPLQMITTKLNERGIKLENIKIKKRPILEQELKFTKAERNAFLESVRQFQNYKQHIYRSGQLKEISSNIGRLIEAAEGFTMNETDGWFDNITVGRDTKRLKDSYKLFEKTCMEITQLQQRLESCYEDIGNGLSKYYDV